MKPYLLCVLVLFAIVSCSPNDPATDESVISPEKVVDLFYDAIDAKDEETAFSLMTRKARESLQDDDSGSGFSLENAQYESVNINTATINGDEADVEVLATQNGESQIMIMQLRMEENAWRIFGVTVDLGNDQKIALDFEKIGDMVSSMVETIGDGLQTSFQEAFENAQAAEQQLRQIQFETLHAINVEEFKSLWTNTNDFKGQTYSDALIALGDSLGLTVEFDQIDSQLDQKVEIDVQNMATLAAIEALCLEAGVYANYPEVDTQLGAWGGALVDSFAEGLAGLFDDETSALGFDGAQEIKDTILTELNRRQEQNEPVPYSLIISPGAAPYPSVITGPFRIGVREIEENAPYGTGTLGLTIQGYGIHESVMALTSKVDEFIVVNWIKSAVGDSLIDPDVRYHSNPSVGGNALTNYLNVSLKNLLRSVESIHVVDGSLAVYVPEQVDLVEFPDLQPEIEKTLGGLSIRIKKVGSNTTLEVEGPEATIEKLMVGYELHDEDNQVIPILFDSAYPWGNKMQIQLGTEVPPKSLVLKLVTRGQELEFPFELNQIPLQHFKEMPVEIEELEFGDNEAPLTVTFERFIDKSPEFNRILVKIENHSNKDVTHAFIQFEYKDEQGKTLKEASTGISGAFNQDGQLPLAIAGGSTRQETTAFYMPENTHTMGIKLNRADFIDGTEWDGMKP